MNIKYIIAGLSLFLFACKSITPPDLIPNTIVPSQKLITYQQMELIGFIHFTVNTFTDKEWGYGNESPEILIPSIGRRAMGKNRSSCGNETINPNCQTPRWFLPLAQSIH